MRTDHQAIVVEGVIKSFGQVRVLNEIDFVVSRGMVLGLLGPNGAGKTTTVRILSTLLKPDQGRALINGFDVVKKASHVRSSIGLAGQNAAVDEYLTGQENLEMMGRLYRLSRKDTKIRAHQLLELFDLEEAARQIVKTYSGGMRRRLDLAISLIVSPQILFLDEPTTGLDPRSRLTMWQIIKQLAATDVTILLTTQYMEEADYLADQIVVIDKGRMIAQGTPNELKARVGSERLEMTISESSSFEAAQQVMDGKDSHVDRNRRSFSIPTEGGAADLKHIWCLIS